MPGPMTESEIGAILDTHDALVRACLRHSEGQRMIRYPIWTDEHCGTGCVSAKEAGQWDRI